MICASLVAGTMAEALEKIANRRDRADLLELRIDLIADLNLASLLGAKTGPVLVTNRRREEGGGFPGTEEERILHLCEAVRLKAEYVDVEATTDGALAGRVLTAAADRGSQTKVIVSFHDFNATPGVGRLHRIWSACREKGGDIVKIVTHARHREDNLRVLSLIPYSRRRGQEAIAFCMGEHGRMSRIMAPLLGAYLTYAALDKGEAAAPGQMTVGEMERILGILAPPREKEGERFRSR